MCWNVPILHRRLCVNVSEAARGEIRSGADPPLEVATEARYWWTEPVWVEKPAAHGQTV